MLSILRNVVGTIGNWVFNAKATGPLGKEAKLLKNSTPTPVLLIVLSDNKQICFPEFSSVIIVLNVFWPLPPIIILHPKSSLKLLNQFIT